MIYVGGLVCVGFQGHRPIQIFGQCINYMPQSYENISSNNLTPFVDEAVSNFAFHELSDSKMFSTVRKGNIELVLAENISELDDFSQKKKLVVVRKNPENNEYMLMGNILDGYGAYPLPGAYFYQNCFKTFRSFERALELLHQVNRQAESPATIGTFRLSYI